MGTQQMQRVDALRARNLTQGPQENLGGQYRVSSRIGLFPSLPMVLCSMSTRWGSTPSCTCMMQYVGLMDAFAGSSALWVWC